MKTLYVKTRREWRAWLKKHRTKEMAEREMTPAGNAAAEGVDLEAPFKVQAGIERALKKDPQTWRNFQRFPNSYKRIRVGFVEGAKNRPKSSKSGLIIPSK